MKRGMLLHLLLLFGFLAGCPAPLSQTYRPAGLISPKPRVDLLVVVKPAEGSPLGEKSDIGPGFRALIPFVLSGHQRWSPERYWNVPTMRGQRFYDFRSDLGDTIAADLQASGIAAKVVCVDNASQAAKTSGRERYLLFVTLKECFWHRHFTCYGLSIPGFFLSFLGLPCSYGNVTLEIDAVLKDADGMEIAKRTFAGRAKATEWVYYEGVYPRGLRAAFAQLSDQLRRFVLENLSR